MPPGLLDEWVSRWWVNEQKVGRGKGRRKGMEWGGRVGYMARFKWGLVGGKGKGVGLEKSMVNERKSM